MLRTLIAPLLPWLAGGALAVILALGVALKIANDRAERAEAEAAAQNRQADLNDAGAKSVDRYVTETKIIREKAEEATNEVRKAPGAGDEFAVRDELCRALERMRDEPVCTDDPGSPDLP